MLRLSVALLGDFHARVGSACPVGIRARRTQALLAYLALPPGQPHSRDKLAALLWGDAPQHHARNHLRQTLFVLRRALAAIDPPCLHLDGESVALSESVDVDAVSFEQLVRDGMPEALEQAIALYRGDLLQGIVLQAAEFEEWLMAERERLRELAIEGMAKLLAHQRGAGRIEAAVQTTQRMLAMDPLQEPVHRTLMRLYAQLGRRAAALRQYQRCVAILKRELGADPEAETREVYRGILHQKTAQAPRPHADPPLGVPAFASTDARRHNLPRQLTSFIGRRKEKQDVTRFLSATTRLLTLTGSGGCGKTRLALEVAGDRLDDYADGVWLVELASLTDPTLVPQAAASALGVREQPGQPMTQTLVHHLKARRSLLILDNCEHLLVACAQLTDAILRSSSHLKVLATSREGLGIGGELTYPVPSLATPDPQHLPPLDLLTQYEAVQLFAERAVFSQPDFAVTVQSAPAVAQICHRLDGIPLAIELAATRVKALPPELIATGLADGFRLLTGGSRIALPRYQTLRATMDWSHDLLTDQERVLLRRLSVFAGGWTLEAAEAICATPFVESLDVLALLVRLVEKSLVMHQGEGGRARYRLLETVRQYAGEKLTESGEAKGVRERHRNFFLALAEEAEPKLWSSEAMSWLGRLDAEHDNLRAALAGSLTPPEATATALRLAGALRRFWFMRNHLSEGCGWMEAALAHAEATAAPSSSEFERAKVLQGLGMIAWRQGELARARESLEASVAPFRKTGELRAACVSLTLLGMVAGYQGNLVNARALEDESVALLRDLGDRWCLALALNAQGLVAAMQNDQGAAYCALEESVRIFRALRDHWSVAVPLANLSAVAYRRGDYATARTLSAESLTFARETENRVGAADAFCVLGLLALDQGDHEAARARFEEGLAIWGRIGEKRKIHWMLEAFARLAASEKEFDRAARLFAAAAGFQEADGPFPLPFEVADRWDHMARDDVRTALGAKAFGAAWAEGRAMVLERAIGYALRESPGD